MPSSRLCVILAVYFMFPMTLAFGNVLDLDEAIQRTLTYSPTIAIANTEIDVKQAGEYQARLLPNPEFAVEVDGADNIVRKRRNDNDQEITYSLSQLIELGGKRLARKQIAAFQTSLAAYDMELVKLDLVNAATKAVIDVIAAQEYVKLAEEQLRIALEVHTTTSAKVQGGKISSLQERKAHLAHITASLNLEKAKRGLELAKKKLASLWGAACPDFDGVAYPLFDLAHLDDLCVLIDLQSNSLDAMRWDLQIALAQQILIGEKAQRIPDVVVTAGYYREDNEGGLLLGFSMPIPIFDRNQGNIIKAKQEINQFYEKKTEGMVQLKFDLEDAYNQLLTAYRQGVTYKENILASARSAFDAAKEEYTRGKNDYLELLDAQRTLFDIQEQYISTLVEYHQRKADVNRLVGLPLINKGKTFCEEPSLNAYP